MLLALHRVVAAMRRLVLPPS
eukprot:SAG31_NODE_25941_length_451_cov_0.860795_1_plen_20_part_10